MAGLKQHSRNPARWLAGGWLGLLGLVALLAPVLPLPYAPGLPDLAHVAQAPFAAGRHWLGTDAQGRDVLSGLVFGTRTALLLTVPAALLAALLGAGAGGAAGFWGNRLRLPCSVVAGAGGALWWMLGLPGAGLGAAVGAGAGVLLLLLLLRPTRRWAGCPLPLDSLVLGAAAVLDTVPRLLLVLVLAASAGLTGPGLALLLALTSWPGLARLVRARMLSVRTLPFIAAAQAAGLPAGRVWWRHALPHAVQPLRVALPLSLAGLLGLESTLSFLGIGLAPEVVSWGQQLATVRQDASLWWTFCFPAALLSLSMLSATSLARSGAPLLPEPAADSIPQASR